MDTELICSEGLVQVSFNKHLHAVSWVLDYVLTFWRTVYKCISVVSAWVKFPQPHYEKLWKMTPHWDCSSPLSGFSSTNPKSLNYLSALTYFVSHKVVYNVHTVL